MRQSFKSPAFYQGPGNFATAAFAGSERFWDEGAT
jgi:hypothetical protein